VTTKSVKAKPPAAAADRVAPNTRSPVARQCPKTGPNTGQRNMSDSVTVAVLAGPNAKNELPRQTANACIAPEHHAMWRLRPQLATNAFE
jgi:hypothetical protein